MYERVLIPTNGTERAARGARHGLRIAAANDATVHVLGVVDTSQVDTVLDRVVGDHIETIERERERAVADVAGTATERGLTVEQCIERGTPHELVREYADRNEVDFIAMGTRSRSRLDRPFLSGVTEQVIRTSAVPVLTAREHGQPERPIDAPYDDILVPTRGGDGAELAIDHAVGLARLFDATVHALYVVDVRSMSAIHETTSLDELIDRLKTEVTDEVVARARAAGLDAEATVRQGTPHEGILGYADDRDVDLLVLGTHGNAGLNRYLIGSVAERTVRTARRPVITVRMDRWYGPQ